MRIASPIVLSQEERAVLSTWSRGRSLPLRLIQRAQIVVMAAQGIPSQDIAQALGVSRPTVQLWRERFLALRLEGLKKDAPRPGRIPSIPEKKSAGSRPGHFAHHTTRRHSLEHPHHGQGAGHQPDGGSAY